MNNRDSNKSADYKSLGDPGLCFLVYREIHRRLKNISIKLYIPI
jgi:hypothetical protein